MRFRLEFHPSLRSLLTQISTNLAQEMFKTTTRVSQQTRYFSIKKTKRLMAHKEWFFRDTYYIFKHCI
jgi:hypothetical protein